MVQNPAVLFAGFPGAISHLPSLSPAKYVLARHLLLVPRCNTADKRKMRLAKQAFEGIVDFALPPRCASCSQIVAAPDSLCSACWGQLDFLTDAGCRSCGLPLPPTIELCAPCMADPPDHDGARAAVVYGDVARSIILRLKHGRRIGLARIVARLMARQMPAGGDWMLVPVPLHRWRIWARGFNQSALIATLLAEPDALQLANDVMMRTRHTPILGGLGARDREKTVRGAFSINDRQKSAIKGRRILLIDDVYTSGATTNACARALKRAGAAEVRVLCWARVVLETAIN